jgi:hypothetical protein
MSIKRKLKKLVDDPQQFFIDSKLVKSLQVDDESKVAKIIKIEKNEANLKKTSTSFRLVVVDASVHSMKLVSESKAKLDEGDIASAVELSDRAVASDKNNLFAYLACCRAREKLEDKVFLLSYAKAAYDLFPDNRLSQLNYALCSRVNGLYTDEIELIYTQIFEKVVCEDDLSEYIQYIWESRAADKKVALTLIDLVQTGNYSDKTVSFIGAYVFDSGLKKESLRLARHVIDNKSGKHLKKYGLYFQYCDLYYGIASSSSNVRTIATLRKLESGEQRLIDRINNSSRVVIVGNSPREIGKKQGSAIDSADIVIRFNNYPDSASLKPDYGSKCDIWVRSVGAWVDTRDETNFKHVVVSGTNLLGRGFNLNHFLHYLEIETEVSVFSPSFHYDLIKILGGPPSAGLMMLYMVYRLKGRLLESDVFGFGFIDQLDEGVENIGKSPAGARHHWQKELDVYQEMLAGVL